MLNTGSWLAALCEDCNHAAHKPQGITVCFHNGGRYDFHFVIRTFAKVMHHVKLAQRAEPTRKIRKFGIKELSERVRRVRELASKKLIPANDEITEALLQSSVSILQKSGESNLTMDIGRLRFVDTMNFCNSGLGKLMDSQRDSALKACQTSLMTEVECLEQAFPVTASRHPCLSGLRDGTDKKLIWDALMRKLPMPWDHFNSPADFDRPPVWDLES